MAVTFNSLHTASSISAFFNTTFPILAFLSTPLAILIFRTYARKRR